MSDDIGDIRDYYDGAAHGEDSRLRSHQLERDITLRYFEDYLPATGQLLEIGAGTGVYTVWLARKGYHVTAVDLSEAMIEMCRTRVAEETLDASVDFRVADARELESFAASAYDAALLMGPLYHLVLKQDRAQALRQAFARLKPGAPLFSALISRFGIMGHLLRNGPKWIQNQKEVRSVIEQGRESEDRRDGKWRGYYATVGEIVPLHEGAGFQTLVLAGVEPAISADDDSYNCLEVEVRKLWLDLLYELSREPSLVASSRHLLYVGRKPK